MDNGEPIYKGFLQVLPVGKSLLRKSWQQKYCLLFKANKFGVDRLEIYDTSDVTKGTSARIITLEDCIKIESKNSTSFLITTKSAVYEFNALTTESMNEWIHAIQSIAFRDDVSRITSIEEDNDLYCSTGEEVFDVKIHSSPVSQRCGLDNKTYTLVLNSTAIQLRNICDNKLLFTWPYRFIRRYGYKSGKFTFEAGRKCETGEGIFFLEHPNQQEIFRCLAAKMKSMKKLISDSTTSLLDVDNQLQAALSMEARSRSPLPPSSTGLLMDMDSSFSSKIQSFDNSRHKSAVKQKPVKPPRKSLIKQEDISVSSINSSISNDNSIPDYEPVDKYDNVEQRNEAWKTLGVVEVKHTEQETDEEYLSWGEVKKVIPSPPKNMAPKVITQSSTQFDDSYSAYDKLDFFGTNTKSNANSTYKQVLPAPIAPVCAPPSFNEYDEVVPFIEGIRLADDSHLGYALIRKEPSKDSQKGKDEKVNHKFHNDEPYAVISKPKRV